jgi:hypothetical protein
MMFSTKHEHKIIRLRVSENGVLRIIFGLKVDDLKGAWRKLHNEEPNGLYCSPNIVRVIKSKKNELEGACSVYGGEERLIKSFGGKT